MPDSEAEKANLEPDGVSFMEMLFTKDHPQVGLQNGFSPTTIKNDRLETIDGGGTVAKNTSTLSEESCPVGLNKAVLLYPTGVFILLS